MGNAAKKENTSERQKDYWVKVANTIIESRPNAEPQTGTRATMENKKKDKTKDKKKKEKKLKKKEKKLMKKLKKLQKGDKKGKKKKSSSSSSSSSSSINDAALNDAALKQSGYEEALLDRNYGKEIDPRGLEAKLGRTLGLPAAMLGFKAREDDEEIAKAAKMEYLANRSDDWNKKQEDWICEKKRPGGTGPGGTCGTPNWNTTIACISCGALRPSGYSTGARG